MYNVHIWIFSSEIHHIIFTTGPVLVYYNKKSSYAYLLRLDDTFVSDLASRLPIHVGPVKEYNALLS